MPKNATTLIALLLSVPSAAQASTGLSELGQMVSFMLYGLPGLLLVLSVVTLLLSRKLGARRSATWSILALMLGLAIALFHGVLLRYPFSPDVNVLNYLAMSAGLALCLVVAESLLCISLLVWWVYTKTRA